MIELIVLHRAAIAQSPNNANSAEAITLSRLLLARQGTDALRVALEQRLSLMMDQGPDLGQVWSDQTCPGMVCAVHQFQIQVMPENPQPSSRFQKNSRVIEIIFRLPRAAQISPQLTRLVMRFGVDDYPFKRPEYNIESAAATIPHAQTIAQTLSRTVLPPEIVAHIAKNYLFEWEWGWGRGALQAVRRSPGRAGGRGRIRSRLLVQIRQRILRRGALATRCAFLDPELGRI
jgi:hypothetical protein